MRLQTIVCLVVLSCGMSTGLLAMETGVENVPESPEVITHEAVTQPTTEPFELVTQESVTQPTVEPTEVITQDAVAQPATEPSEVVTQESVMPAVTRADDIVPVSTELACSAEDYASCCVDQAGSLGPGCCKVSGDCDVDIPKRRFYITGIIGASFGTLQSSGTNTEGDFENTGGASDNLLAAGGAIGEVFERSNGLLRLEVEGRGRSLLAGQTNSFEPPTPTYFYATRVADSWSLMANAWRDWNLTDRLGVYAGGGIGVSGYRLTVDDSVVSGYGQMTAFAGQVGTGMTFKLTDRITLDLGYRLFGTDSSSLPINVLGGGAPAGTYQSNFYSTELLLSVRIYEPFSIRSVR